MFLARVTGVVVATIKHPHLNARKLLLVRPEPTPGRPQPPSQIAVDTVDAGPGDRVLVADEGNAAAQVLGMPRGPVRTIIVGVVDDVMSEGGGGPAAPGPGARRGAAPGS
jgi:ethanolamine utilization protein EutN